MREAFIENFASRHELGGACCVFRRGEKIVDLWGGLRNKTTENHGSKTPWLLSGRRAKASLP